MEFEQSVLEMVRPFLNSGTAEFYNGTLFLENVSGENGRFIYDLLLDEFGADNFRFNIYNPVNGFVVDFI